MDPRLSQERDKVAKERQKFGYIFAEFYTEILIKADDQKTLDKMKVVEV